MLQRPGIPLFLQFKLSHRMVRNNALEVRHGVLVPPFYRMHLQPSRHSDQHEMLLELENKGNEVYYSAPAFHKSEEFNEAYLSHQVKARSLWMRPSQIGPLPDDRDHHVAFVLGNTPYLCSGPRALDARGNFEEFEESVIRSFQERARTAMTRNALEQTARNLSDIAEKYRHVSFDSESATRATLEERHPLAQIAFYSQIFLDAQLFIVREQGDIDGPAE